MKKILQFFLAGIVIAIGGIFFSDLVRVFFNGMDYGTALVSGICVYLCVVVVTCTGVIVSKLDKNSEDDKNSKESHDKEKD